MGGEVAIEIYRWEIMVDWIKVNTWIAENPAILEIFGHTFLTISRVSEKVESRMTLIFLSWSTGRTKVSLIKMQKTEGGASSEEKN